MARVFGCNMNHIFKFKWTDRLPDGRQYRQAELKIKSRVPVDNRINDTQQKYLDEELKKNINSHVFGEVQRLATLAEFEMRNVYRSESEVPKEVRKLLEAIHNLNFELLA